MTVGYTNAIDVTAANYEHAPVNNMQVCLYVTGTPDIVATPEMREAHPSAVLIDQSSMGGQWDATADVQDYERGAVDLQELSGRVFESRSAFATGERPGQRQPAVYVSRNNAQTVATAMATTLDREVNLWVADWSISVGEAIALLGTRIGDCVITGVQYEIDQYCDKSVFVTEWLDDKSKRPQEKVSVTPGNGLIDIGDVSVGQIITVYYSDNIIAKQLKVTRPGAQRISGLAPGSYNLTVIGNNESAYVPDIKVKLPDCYKAGGVRVLPRSHVPLYDGMSV